MKTKGTILVVDDTPANLRLLVETLAAAGYTALPADSGELALAAVAARLPELILLDLRMPGLDGLEVCRRLKARAESRWIPVILISGDGESAERMEGFKAGAVDFITKPIQPEELLARVQTHLELRRLQLHAEQQATALAQTNAQLQHELEARQRSEAAAHATSRAVEASYGATLNLVDDAVEAKQRLETANAALRDELAARARAEVALRESEALLRESQQIAGLGGYALNVGTGIWQSSAVLDQVFGIDAAYERSVAGWSNLIHPADRPMMAAYFQEEVLGRGAVFDRHYRIVRHCDHAERWVHGLGRLECDAQGHPVMMRGTIQDITERKQAEAAVRENRARLDAALASMTDAVFISDTAGQLIEFNAAFATFHKFKTKAECGRWLSDYPAILEVFMANGELAALEQWAVPRALRGETATNVEYRLRRKDTGETWFGSYSFSPIRDAVGAIIGSVVVARDITRQKQAEAKLRTSEQMLQNVLDHFPGGVFWKDRQSNYLGCNLAFAVGAGLPQSAAIIGKTDFDLPWAATEAEAYRSDDAQVMASGEAKLHIIEQQHQADGRVIWLDTSKIPLSDAAGQITGVLGVAEDITERRQAEEALQQSEDRFAVFMAHLPAAVFIKDVEGRTLFANEYLQDLMGFQNWEKKTTRELIPGKAGEQMVEADRRALTEGRLEVLETVVDVSGARRTFETLKFPLHSAGQPVLLGGISLDVTARQQAEAEIRQLNAELEQRVRRRTAQLELANKELESFSYAVSHDLRAPLRGIDGWSQALLEDYGASFDATATSYLHRVRAESQRMGQLIDALLQLSRLSRVELRFTSVDFTALAQRIIARLQAAAAGREIEFIVQPGLVLWGVETLWEIALTNLLENAAKFTGRCAHARIEVGQTETDAGPVFFVRDNGVGFDPQHAQKLFGAFQRLHTTKDFPGTGIGLATVQRIIHRHGGRIWAEAQVGCGATFYFTTESSP